MSDIYILSDKKIEGALNLPVFQIKYLPAEVDILKYDALIFTSKNAIYSLDFFNTNWKQIPSFAIAPLTAEVISNYGGKVEYIGKSAHGDDFAEELKTKLKGKKAIYIRAKKVVSRLVEILRRSNIDIDELITYETVCSECNNLKQPSPNSTIIFSSPSTIKCFLRCFDWDSSYKAVAIGKTTAKYLPDFINYRISPSTSLEVCVKLAKTL